jgi:type I restriction enzyme R subunit
MIGKLFDPEADVLIEERLRLHWSQAGAIVFITFRTKDSIPKAVVKQWDAEKRIWLVSRGLLGKHTHWSEALPALTETQQLAFAKAFNRTREDFLDTCQGRCLLRRPELAKIVATALRHFDGERYRLVDFVIMPNHVHLLAAFPKPEAMREQCASWMRFTATAINKVLGETGPFWQAEPFDHLVRTESQYDYLRRYISENPEKANLKEGESLYVRQGR